MIEDKPKEKSRACFVIHDDEGFDWSSICPEEDRLENVRKTAHGRAITEKRKFVFVAEIQDENKDKDTTEIRKETMKKKKKLRSRRKLGKRS
ncbi:hypothetical protein Hanom_Chr09g00842611 [Helianthus anomalus]